METLLDLGPLCSPKSSRGDAVPMVARTQTAGFSAHERTAEGTEEWLTPREITDALGPFDLDPCSPIRRPWATARRHFTIEDDGLKQQWSGRVWLNPPYGTETEKWMSRMAGHNHGTALIFARTETATWFESVWPVASAVFFFRGRLAFCHVDGRRAQQSAGAPSALIAYGQQDIAAIERSGIKGRMVRL